MEAKNNISKHLDELMAQAEKGEQIQTRTDFLQRLNKRIDEQAKPKANGRIYTFKEVLKYAAIIVITILNLSAIFLISQTAELNSDIATTNEVTITEFADQYFPEYSYSELEEAE